MPVAATVHSAAGAQAFAVFFVKTIDWGYATTSSAYMRHYYDPKTCGECEASAKTLDLTRGKKWHYLGGRIHPTVTGPYADRQQFGSQYIEQVRFDVEALTAVDAHGNIKNADLPRKNGRVRIYCAWEGDHWTVVLLYFPA